MNWTELKTKYGPYVFKAIKYVIPFLLGAIATWLGVPPETVEKIKEVERLVFVPAPDGVSYTPTFGWVKDEGVIQTNLDEEKTPQFHNTPAGKAVMGDEDVFLWQAVRKVNGKADNWYPNINQMSVGCCVGCGFKHSADVVQATAILGGGKFDWKPTSAEVIYGGSRVEVGGGRISGDGSVGQWAAKWVKEWGVVPMEKIDGVDLTVFSPARAREFGRKGVPDSLEPLARQHPVKGIALVRSANEAKRSIQQGYPIAVCSDQGFTMERDRDGFARASGTWYHCMAIIGYRGGNRPGFFILNSWGDQAHTGGVWPKDMPVAGFWADYNVVDRMLRQGDSFALADVQGFPTRKIPDDWFIAAPKRRALDIFAQQPDWRLAP